MASPFYFDYAATTPVDPRVLEVMLPYFTDTFGNPSSIHRFGQKGEAAVETARETIAGVLNCRSEEIIFTSCGTESDNLALRGVCEGMRERNRATWLLTSRTEHPAVSNTAEHLAARQGFQVEWLKNDEYGMIEPMTVGSALCRETALVSIMYANNEIGSVNPIREIADYCRAYGVPLHTDAVQAAAYLPLDVQALGIDLLSLGGHKLYGPKGVGALYVRKGTAITPVITGGGQEFSLRAGTLNVPYIVGLAEAVRLTSEERLQRIAHVQPLRDRIIATVLATIPEVKLTGHPERRLPNHASFVFKDLDGNLLLTLLDSAGFACSSGSACKTGNPEPSGVMTAIGLERAWGLGSLRISLGKGTTSTEVDAFLVTLPDIVSKARSIKAG